MLSATRRCLFSGATRTAASAPAVGAAAVRQLQLRTVRTQPSIGRVARPAYGAEQQVRLLGCLALEGRTRFCSAGEDSRGGQGLEALVLGSEG